MSGLAQTQHPALQLDQQGAQPKDWRVALMPVGQQLLSHQVDWLRLNPVLRWLGGVSIDGRAASTWRFDGMRGVVLHRRTP